ncbi:MAG: FKBP-type peptidyl-prolyl cis-trans isomerase [Deltaproteobacteria bacterium]|nr:FKBP-type peptidyl-prolyl cis-trans isomerase [Deltaproteobacteria bacterium]
MKSTPLALSVLIGSISLNGCSDNKTETAPPPAAAQAPTPPKPNMIPPPADVAAPPADAQKTASGLAYKVLKAGTGTVHPTPADGVTVHYTGWTTNGQMFDSSVRRGEPAIFPLGRVIPGWTEGLQLMVEGQQNRFWIPANLAYGETPARPGAPAGMLVFDVELLKVMATPTTPADVAAAPKDAKKTKSGLAYKVLKPGTGTTHPGATDMVEVEYTGWTTDGKAFDSSVTTGKAARFRLDRVITGWGEGLQLMVEGEKTRFWIPGALAYGDKAGMPGGPPAGQLTFDVELVHFVPTPPAAAAGMPPSHP